MSRQADGRKAWVNKDPPPAETLRVQEFGLSMGEPTLKRLEEKDRFLKTCHVILVENVMRFPMIWNAFKNTIAFEICGPEKSKKLPGLEKKRRVEEYDLLFAFSPL